MISRQELRRLLHYDPRTGRFVWIITPKHGSTKAGDEAGCVKFVGVPRRPYRYIKLFGCGYRAHRLAFLYMLGVWPPADVDHRNGETLNNRWRNLREATRSQNMANQGAQANNALGLKGVSRCGRRYRAQVQKRYLGCFDTAEEAHAAYRVAAREHFGEFARFL